MDTNKKYFIKLLASFIVTFGLTAMCILTAYVCTSGGSFLGFEFSPASSVTHVNTMLMGLDKGGTRADVMILGQLNMAEGEINMLQIPRDTYVENNGRYDKKINSAYGHEKEKTVFKEVKQVTGIDVDKYVIVDTTGFKDLIDTIGGVEFDVPQAMHYDDPYQDLHIHLEPGLQHLDGDKAEQLVRFRSYPEGDIQRMRVQSDFIQATVDQLFTLANMFKISDLVEDISKIVDTNFTINELLTYAPYIFSTDRNKILTHQLAGVPQYKNGISYVMPDYAANEAIRLEHFTVNTSEGYVTKEDIEKNLIGGSQAYESVGGTRANRPVVNPFTSVDIIDASGGAADITVITSKLKECRFNVRSLDKADETMDKTLIISESKSSGAAAVGACLGLEEYLVNSNRASASDVVLIVGSDFVE